MMCSLFTGEDLVFVNVSMLRLQELWGKSAA